MTDRLDYRAIGSRVRELRLQHKMTQEYLAELVDISPSFIGHIERGEKKPSLETMSRLTTVLDTSMDYLILGIRDVLEAAGIEYWIISPMRTYRI